VRTVRVILRFIQQELLDGADVDGDPLAQGLVDSLGREQLAAFLEERFGIRLESEEVGAEQVTSVRSLAALVDAKRAARR
jgi:acyl carrier protein